MMLPAGAEQREPLCAVVTRIATRQDGDGVRSAQMLPALF